MNTPRKREKKMKGEFKKKPREEKMELMIKVIISFKYFVVSDWLQSPS